MTAHAAALLVDSKNLTWEQPISNDYRTHFNNATWKDSVTLVDLLSHRTGLDGFMQFAAADLPTDEIIRFSEQAPSVGTFRDSYNYNNQFFSLVGRMMSKGSSDPFDGWKSLIKTHIFDKLGMNSSTVEASDYFNGQNTAFPHMYSPEPISSNGSYVVKPKNVTSWAFTKVAPAAGVVTTVEDITKWLSYLLHSFKGNTTAQIVSKESHDMIFKVHNLPGSTGLGVFNGTHYNQTYFLHQGDADGVSSELCLSPVYEVGIFVIVNTNDKHLYLSVECRAMFDIVVHNNATNFTIVTNEKLEEKKVDIQKQNTLSRAVADYGKNATVDTTLPIQSYVGIFNTTEDMIHGYNVTIQSIMPLILNFEHVYPFKVQPTMPHYKNYQLLHQGGDEFALVIGNHSFPTEGSVTFLIGNNAVVGLNLTTPLPLDRF